MDSKVHSDLGLLTKHLLKWPLQYSIRWYCNGYFAMQYSVFKREECLIVWKKKPNRDIDPSIIIRRASLWYRIRGVAIIVLWIVFAASVCVKLLMGRGIVASIPGIVVAHGTLLSPGPLFEVAKALGICSLFIVWIYAELGKYELGRRYTELLSDFCRFYHLRALSYIIAILACMYISTAGVLESAGIAMIIAVLGLWDQAGVLIGFIFKPVIRKELAVKQWDLLLSPKSDAPATETSLSDLYTLANNISAEDEYFDKLCENMAKGILSLINKEKDVLCANGNGIVTISYVWERLLNGRSDHEQSLILHHVLNHTENCLSSATMLNHTENCLSSATMLEETRIFVCSSYLYRQFRYYSTLVESGTTEQDPVLLRILSDVDLLHQMLHSTNQKLISCLNTLHATFCWMFFLCNKINLSHEILEFFVNYQKEYDDSSKDFVRLFARCTFSEETCNMYFDTAWNQVKKP